MTSTHQTRQNVPESGPGPTRIFRAAAMRDAFAAVKAAIGPEAIILATRDLGASVGVLERYEVVAAYPARDDRAAAPQRAAHALTPARQQFDARGSGAFGTVGYDDRPRAIGYEDRTRKMTYEDRAREQATRQATAAPAAPDQSEAIARQLRMLEQAMRSLEAQFQVLALRQNTAQDSASFVRPLPAPAPAPVEELRIALPLWHAPRGTRAALIGPAGAGKTTTLLKIAGMATFAHGRSVGCITMDVERLGAREHLALYADVLGVPVLGARDEMELEHALDQFRDKDLILIDTAGHTPVASEAGPDPLDAIARPDIGRHLVLQGTLAPAYMAELIARYPGSDPSRALASLIVTNLDAVQDLTPIATCVRSARVPLSHVSDGREIPDHIRAADAQSLARDPSPRAS